jgi:hypothetical protein
MSYAPARLIKLIQDDNNEAEFFEIVNFDGPDKILYIKPDHVFLLCGHLIKSKPDHQQAAFMLVQTIFSVQTLTQPGLFIPECATYFFDIITQMPDPIMRLEILKLWTICFNCSNWNEDKKYREKLDIVITSTVNQILADPTVSHIQKYDAFATAGSDRRDSLLAEQVEKECLENGTAIQFWNMKVRQAKGLKYQIILFNTLISAAELTNNPLLRTKAFDMVDYNEELLDYKPIADLYNQEFGFDVD